MGLRKMQSVQPTFNDLDPPVSDCLRLAVPQQVQDVFGLVYGPGSSQLNNVRGKFLERQDDERPP